MDKQEQIKLISGFISGDEESAIKLTQEGVRLSVLVAAKYSKIGSDDFYKHTWYAFKGFLIGINKYIKAKRYKEDYKFTTYATYFMKKEVEKVL